MYQTGTSNRHLTVLARLIKVYLTEIVLRKLWNLLSLVRVCSSPINTLGFTCSQFRSSRLVPFFNLFCLLTERGENCIVFSKPRAVLLNQAVSISYVLFKNNSLLLSNKLTF